MERTLEEEVGRIVASMESEEPNEKEQEKPGTTEQEIEPAETVHIHYFPDAIVIVKEGKDSLQEDNVVETTLAQIKKPPVFIAYATIVFYLLLIFSCIAFQIYEILNPPIATVTIILKSQTVTLTGTLQLGRVLQPLTISQSQTTPTTGKRHQDPTQAHGSITFYNGQLNSVTVPAGTTLTGSDGVQIATDQDAYIPAESQTIPPTLGQTTISAHALVLGTKGNIPTGDINRGCCAPTVLAQNPTPFHGGLDERDFQTVAKRDIDTTATTLKTNLAQSVTGAFQGQLKPQEQLQFLLCAPTVSSDHQPGQEAQEIRVTESLTCSAIAYNTQELESKAVQLLSIQAIKQLGTGYIRIGAVTTSIIKTTAVKGTVTLAFSAYGTWVYQIQEELIKKSVAGKTLLEAERILRQQEGIKSATIENAAGAKLPNQASLIHLVILEGVGF